MISALLFTCVFLLFSFDINFFFLFFNPKETLTFTLNNLLFFFFLIVFRRASLRGCASPVFFFHSLLEFSSLIHGFFALSLGVGKF